MDAPPHWIRWGKYERYAGDPADPCRRVKIPRYWCKIVGRTFSLPPDFLLPRCGVRTRAVRHCLRAFFVKKKINLSKEARKFGVSRSGIRYLIARFLRTLPKLRLPGREGFLPPPAFLGALADRKPTEITRIFREWKEHEPKLSIVGIYVR